MPKQDDGSHTLEQGTVKGRCNSINQLQRAHQQRRKDVRTLDEFDVAPTNDMCANERAQDGIGALHQLDALGFRQASWRPCEQLKELHFRISAPEMPGEEAWLEIHGIVQLARVEVARQERYRSRAHGFGQLPTPFVSGEQKSGAVQECQDREPKESGGCYDTSARSAFRASMNERTRAGSTPFAGTPSTLKKLPTMKPSAS